MLASGYHVPKERIVDTLTSLLGLFHFPERKLCLDALELWVRYPIDVTEAFIIAEMHKLGITDIYASQRELDTVVSIKRIVALSP